MVENLYLETKFMRAARFLDTNILLYAYDLDAPAKRQIAQALLEKAWLQSGQTAVSVQVLQEFHYNFVRKGFPATEATILVHDFSAWPIVENTLPLFHSSLNEQARWKISLWDSLILAAARASGASELLTENLNHGQDYDGLKVINPFRKS